MSLEMAPSGFNPSEFRPPHRLTTVEVDKPTSDLERVVAHLRNNWRQEGLPWDWHRLSGVGFNMDLEMNLLTNENRPLGQRVDQVKRNILGFAIEYLQGDHVYPVEYSVGQDSDGRFLFDERYQERMITTVSEKERGGSVRRSLSKIESFLLSDETAEGSIAVMPSPSGPTGLTDNDGDFIEYPDAYWFLIQKLEGGRFVGFGLRTDFTLRECQAAIKKITGKELSLEAPIEEYVSAVALIPSGQGIDSAKDFLDALRSGRNDFRKNQIYKNKGWEQVYVDIDRGEELYRLGLEADRIVDDFTDFALSKGHSQFELRQALAATILRLSKHYLIDMKKPVSERENYLVEGDLIRVDRFERREAISYGYGQAMDEASEIPGCGGGSSSEKSIIEKRTKKIRDWSFDKEGVCRTCGSAFRKLGPCDVCEPCNDKMDSEAKYGKAA